ncbi:uncharacterized protein [Arachis hypogaea]|uniref:uncharacterized protein n=1 Tax=Arachis hypogaea TaxID=3818 RepID=UPI003B21B2D4
MVKEEWRNLGDLQFIDKMKALTVSLSKWHKENFRDMDMKIMKFEEEIKKVDDMVSNGVVDGTVEARRRAPVSSCKKWYIRKELHWKQMSRSRHAKEMDKNTRYFHNLASARRRNNRIESLLIHGRIVRNQARIKVAIRYFYKNLYHQDTSPVIGFCDVLVNRITEEEAAELEWMPSNEKIKDAVALAPKFVEAKEIKDLRPISMVGCVYKVISKILIRRIRKIMPGLVGETQSAFVQGRKIHDGALIACETVQWLKLRKKNSTIIKLDFQKAYDRVKWSFVDIVLQKMGFGRR